MWPMSVPSAIAHLYRERRAFRRQIIEEEAELFIPMEDMRLPCIVVNMSSGGAKVSCDAIPPPGSNVILFFKGGMSVEAVTTRYEQGALGLKFTTGGDK
jgi:hypothetical protein